MANKIYLSDIMTNGAIVAHSYEEGNKVQLAGSVRIPAGSLLATTDKVLLGRFPTGVVFDQILSKFPALDAGTTLTLNVGYDRPVVDPALAYDATTNPYIDDAIATADPDFFEAADTKARAGGNLNLMAAGFTITTSPSAAGFVDVSITPAANATTATTADSQIDFTVLGFLADAQVQGEFSGADAEDYNTNYPTS